MFPWYPVNLSTLHFMPYVDLLIMLRLSQQAFRSLLWTDLENNYFTIYKYNDSEAQNTDVLYQGYIAGSEWAFGW